MPWKMLRIKFIIWKKFIFEKKRLRIYALVGQTTLPAYPWVSKQKFSPFSPAVWSAKGIYTNILFYYIAWYSNFSTPKMLFTFMKYSKRTPKISLNFMKLFFFQAPNRTFNPDIIWDQKWNYMNLYYIIRI